MRICYTTDGQGFWSKRVYKDQCDYEFILGGKCQGTLGHAGKHWCYKQNGSLQESGSGYTSTIPPGHRDYTTPEMKYDFRHSNYFEESEVLDAKEIERLEARELLEGESIIGPVF